MQHLLPQQTTASRQLLRCQLKSTRRLLICSHLPSYCRRWWRRCLHLAPLRHFCQNTWQSAPANQQLRSMPSWTPTRCAFSSVWVIIRVFSLNLICSSRGFAEDEPLFLCSSTVLCKVSSSAGKGNKPAEIMFLTNLVCFWRWKIMACTLWWSQL